MQAGKQIYTCLTVLTLLLTGCYAPPRLTRQEVVSADLPVPLAWQADVGSMVIQRPVLAGD